MELPLEVSERRSISWTPVIATLALAVWLASAAYMWHFGGSWHLDLRVYRAAGRSLLDNGSPFRSLFTANRLPFTYPSFALLVLTPLAFGPLGLIEGAWWLANSVALVATLYLLIPSGASRHVASRTQRLSIAALLGGAATLVLEPVRSNMDYGQINLLLTLLVVVDLNQKRPRFRGLAIGLAAAMKLTPIVYLLFFAVRRDWRSVARGAASFGVLTLLAWLVLPGESALYWLHEVTDAPRMGPIGSVSNQSWSGVLHRAPFVGDGWVIALWVVLCVATVVIGGLVCRRLVADHRPLVESVVVLALVELLISPVSWSHHWSWMAAAPIAAASLWRTYRRISLLVVAAIVVSAAAPYSWGIQRGVGSFVADNSLALIGAVVLLGSSLSLFSQRLDVAVALTTDDDPSE